MAFRKSRRLTAVILTAAILAATFLSGFTYQDGIGSIYYETESEIFNDVTCHKQLGGHSVNGIERAYFVNADIQNTELMPYVFEGEVTGTYTIDTMVNTLESQGYHVIAGINGDLYDTATGTSKGLVIHDGKIKTSGYAPEYVISFDNEGAASLQRADLEYTLKGMINVPTTVLIPQPEPTQTTDPSSVFTTDSAVQSGNPDGQTNSIQTDNGKVEMNEPPAMTNQIIYVPTEYNAAIGFFNVPHGESKALHLFNRQFASSTRTNTTSVEVILDAGSPEDAELSVDNTFTATVVKVINGNFNTAIGENQFVLSTPGDSSYAVQLAQLIPGSTVEISVNDRTGGLEDSKEAIGVYYVMCDNGQIVSNGTNVNPRTAIGIKPDGSLLLYVLDGRQPNFSAGLGLTDMMKHMMALGCSTVVNMDGGGSSAMVIREGGIDRQAAVKNSPSSGVQRKTTNGLFLVYRDKGGTKAENLHTYVNSPLAMPGADVQLTTYASNDKYEPVQLRRGVNYFVDNDSDSYVDEGGLFTAGSNIGTEVIDVESGNLNATVKVDIQDDITYTTNVQNLVIDPGKTADINVTAKFGYAHITSKDNLFTWSCDPNIGTIDENGLYQASSETGISGNIYVDYKGDKKTIPVQIGAPMIDFNDTTTHWAREYIGRLAARGIVNGMGENLYLPDDPLTRAQFLTMLAKMIYGLDTTQTAPAGFTDVPETEWFYNYINWGFENGIVRGIDDVTFAPNERITREQMAIMLDNFTRSNEMILPESGADIAVTDIALISPWAEESVNKIISSGIMSGYPEGDYRPQGQATRAEAATVIYKLINIRDNIAKASQ
ncbi:MAG: S-layer homology domain-containing protein [Eubacteriales bacterium]|nr:S-layer homology domain-containing protein [Eubacteriales bacterium]